MISNEARQAHEEFVSNYSGENDVLGCFLFIAHGPLLILLYRLISSKMQDSHIKVLSLSSSITILVKEYVCIIFPMILTMTVLSAYSRWTLSIIVSVTIIVYTYTSSANNSRDGSSNIIQSNSSLQHSVTKHEHRAISYFKGINMIITCIAILAVDFPIFSRSYAKSQSYGIALMDFGVSSFIITSAFTSKYARGVSVSNISISNNQTSPLALIIQKVKQYFQQCMILVLGIGRMVSLQLLNYQQHDTEYGTHWNFFVTIFVVWLLVDSIHAVVPNYLLVPLSILLLSLHQILLVTTGYTSFVLIAPRTDFISCNREGLASLPGCTSMFILAEAISKSIFFSCSTSVNSGGNSNNDSNNSKKVKTAASLSSSSYLINVCSVCLICSFTWYLCHHYVQETSRRLMNAAFIALSLSISTFILTLCLFVEWIVSESAVLSVEMCNTHQLLYFLLSNVFTGIVNLSMKTITADAYTSIAILCLYSLLTLLLIHIISIFKNNSFSFSNWNNNMSIIND